MRRKGKTNIKGSRARLLADINNVKTALGKGSKAFREGASKGISRAGLRVEKMASEACPKRTTQLSKTIGHYRVDPDTAEDAQYEYGKVQDINTAIWKKIAWNHLILGTQADYAEAVHDNNPFMLKGLIYAAPEVIEIIKDTTIEEIDKKLKEHGFRVQ